MRRQRWLRRRREKTDCVWYIESCHELSIHWTGWSMRKESKFLKQKQVEQSSDNRCVLVRPCTSICNTNCSFTCTFVLVTLKCITNCLNLTFHTLTYLHFAQKWHFFEISTRVWLTDGRTDGRTDGQTDTPSYRDARTHLKTWISLRITFRMEKEATY